MSSAGQGNKSVPAVGFNASLPKRLSQLSLDFLRFRSRDRVQVAVKVRQQTDGAPSNVP